MFETSIWIKRGVRGIPGVRREKTLYRSKVVPVTYDLTEETSREEEIEHGRNLVRERARHASNLREGAGHMGAGALGNQMLARGQALNSRAQDAALQQLGIHQYYLMDSEAEADAFFDGRPWPERIHVVI